MKEEKEKPEVVSVENPPACTKDSDCQEGYVCINGKCMPDIGIDEKG